MKMKKLGWMLLGWVAAITGLHLASDFLSAWDKRSVAMNDLLPLDKRKLNVAYIPVT